MDIDNLLKDKSYQRFSKHFPRNDDLMLIIIKGHLLIEVEINNLLTLLVKNGKHLEKAKLNYHQKICLLKSLLLKGTSKGTLFNRIEMINNIRNQIAHNLEPKELDGKVRNLLYCLLPEWKDMIGAKDKDQFKLLRIGIAQLLGQLSLLVNKLEI